MDSKKKYMSSIFGDTSKGVMGSINKATGLQPKTTPTPVVNMTKAPNLSQTPAAKNFATGATAPVPTTITAPKTTNTQLPPAGQQYTNSLLSGNASSSPVSTIPNPTATPAPTISGGTSSNQPYIDYMKSIFNPEQIKVLAQKKEQEAARADEIRARNEKMQLDAIAEQEKRRVAPGGLVAGAKQDIGEIGRKATLESAYGALEENTAINAAKRAEDVYNNAIATGKSLYEAEQEAMKAKEDFTLGDKQTRWTYDQATGEYKQVGGGNSTEMPQTYTEGTNPAIDSYINGIKNKTLKISDVPDQYKDLVAQGLDTKTQKITDTGREVLSIVDTLLTNPELSRISGTIDQYLGGMVSSDAKLAKNYFNQLVGILKLDNREKLKGSGAISDFEFKVLGEAATPLGRNLSDDAFKAELQKLKDKLSGNAPLPTTPTNGDVWKSPEGEEFEFKNGYWEEMPPSFSKVGNTTASNVPQRNKNPGNIKKGGLADKMAVGVDNQGHLIFPDEQTGFKAMILDIQAKVNGQSRYLKANPTIAELGRVYAEDPNWSKSVARILGVNPNTPTKQVPINNLVQAIARQEGYFA